MKYQPTVISETWSHLETSILLKKDHARQLVSVRRERGFQKFALLSASQLRAMQKMSQFRRLKLEEVKVLAEEGIELNAVDYQRQVEEREAQRRQEREERLAREAMMTLQAMEQQEQKAAASVHNEGTNGKGLSSVELSLMCYNSMQHSGCGNLLWTFLAKHDTSTARVASC